MSDSEISETIVGYLMGKGYVSLDDISKNCRMSKRKVYTSCKKNRNIMHKVGDLFKYVDFEALTTQIVNYLRKNSEVSLDDMCFVCRAAKGEILSVCIEHEHITSRHLYRPGGRITLYKYNEF